MLINCLLSPVCVAARLPCCRVLGGFRVMRSEREKKRWGRWKGERRGDNRGMVCRGLCTCKWHRAISSESSAVSVWTAVLPCWTWKTASWGLAGFCAHVFFPAVYSAALCKRAEEQILQQLGEQRKFQGISAFFFGSKTRYLAQLLPLGKLTLLMILCCLFKELEPLKSCEEICNCDFKSQNKRQPKIAAAAS